LIIIEVKKQMNTCLFCD